MIDPNDLIGHKFGKLTILEFVERDKHKHIMYRCKCECGGEKIASRSSLIHGHTKTCGCWARNKSLVHKRAQHQKEMEKWRNKK